MKKILALYLVWLERYPICNETAIYYGGPDIFDVFALIELVLNGHRRELIEEEVSVSGYLLRSWFYPLITFDGCLKSVKYIDLLEEHLPTALKRFSNNQLNNIIRQQDNARPHVSKVTEDFVKKNNI